MDPKPQSAPPSYSDAVYDGPAGSPAASDRGAYGPGGHGPDIQYVKSICGIAKIVQMVMCLIGFIINVASVGYAGAGFVSFSLINGFLDGVIWFVLHLLHAIPQIFANYYIELIFYSFSTLCLLISALISAAAGWIPPIGAVCFFCFAATTAFTVDLVLQIIELRRKILETRATTQQPS